MTVLGPARVTPGGRYGKGVWHGSPFAPDDVVERYITSEFGAWEEFRQELGWAPHAGIDIHARVGTPLHAMAPGIVEVAGTSGFYPVAGIFVQIQHEDDIETKYLHMSEVAVTRGDTVERGALIGWSGDSSSIVTAAHLHLSVTDGGVYVNPELYLAPWPPTPTPEPEPLPEDLPLTEPMVIAWQASKFYTGQGFPVTKGPSSPYTLKAMGAQYLGRDENDVRLERFEIRMLRDEDARYPEIEEG